MYLPADRTEVNESWLADTLSESGSFPDVSISHVSLQHLGDGLGQLSSLALADIELSSGESYQLVIKLHAPIPAMHEIGLKYGHYESEVKFFNHFADQIPIRTPRIYANAMDPVSTRVLIIMESFADWHSPDQVAGATADEIRTAADQLTSVTATFWNKPIMDTFPWVRNMDSACYDPYQADYIASTEPMLQRLDHVLNEDMVNAIKAIGPRINELKQRNTATNQVLAHWDYRVENLFFRDEDFAVIDWQLMMLTSPATDLAYLLSPNIDVELRRQLEPELFDLFLDGLRKQCVTGYDRNQLEHDYRLALLTVSGIPVIAGASFDESNERSAALFTNVATRMFSAIND